MFAEWLIRDGILAKIDREDRAWYLAVPALAYGTARCRGIVLAASPAAGRAGTAAGTCLLLLGGVRNAWDMTTWLVMRRPN